MIKREKKHRLDSAILDKHPEITARMRAVLIDWLIEVSEVYTLHRYRIQPPKSGLKIKINFLGKLFIWR